MNNSQSKNSKIAVRTKSIPWEDKIVLYSRILGRRIAILRASYELTQQQLAEKLECSDKYISVGIREKTGSHKISIKNFRNAVF